MAFWVGWPLWEKLVLVLGLLIILVLITAFCILVLQQWRTRRYAAAEAHQKVDDPERYPMLAQDDIPFGARAIQRGVQVEGIWISNHNSPISMPSQLETSIESGSSSPAPELLPAHSETAVTSPGHGNIPTTRASLPPFAPVPMHPDAETYKPNRFSYELQRPGGVYSPAMTSNLPISPSNFHRHSETLVTDDKRASFHPRAFPASQLSETKSWVKPNYHDEAELHSAGNDAGARPPAEQQASRMTRIIRRRSSEEFKRRMSAIFNERINPNFAGDQLQFDAAPRQKRRSFRKSMLEPFRS